MKIVDLDIIPFRTAVDRFQHGVLRPQTPIVQTLTRLSTDDGAVGYCLGGQGHGDQDGLTPASRSQLLGRMQPLLVGQNPFDREAPMDPDQQFCHNMTCPLRDQVGQGNIQIQSRKERRYRCTACGHTVAASSGTPSYRLHHAPGS